MVDVSAIQGLSETRAPEGRGHSNVFEAHLADLRRVFDASFAAPPRAAETEGELVLAIRAAGKAWAIRLRDVDGVHECRKIVPLPESPPSLLGITAIRGRLYAAHLLSKLLGGDAAETPRWLVIAGGDEPLGLAIEAIDACLEVSPAEIVAVESGEAGGGAFVREIVMQGALARGILDIPTLVARARREVEAPG